MGKKLYIRNFPSDADEKTLFRQFGKKKVEKVDIIEKKDENGEIISRFCYLYTFLDEQEKLKLYDWCVWVIDLFNQKAVFGKIGPI